MPHLAFEVDDLEAALAGVPAEARQVSLEFDGRSSAETMMVVLDACRKAGAETGMAMVEPEDVEEETP